MTIIQCEYIVAVDRERNFRRAAEACFVTQPTLSVQLQKAESDLGVVIFDRSKSPIKPTRLGEKIVEQARAVLAEVHRFREIVQMDSGLVTGHLRVGVIPTVSAYLVPSIVKRMRKKYEKLSLDIFEITTENCLKSLDQESIDVAILATREDPKKYSQTSLFSESMQLFVNPKNPLLKKKRVELCDLEPDQLWLLEEGHCLREEVLRFCKFKEKEKKVLNQSHFRVGTLESLRNLVQENFGYTFLPYLSTLRLAPRDKKLLIEFSGKVPKRTLFLTQSRSELKKAAIQALKTEILEAFPPEKGP